MTHRSTMGLAVLSLVASVSAQAQTPIPANPDAPTATTPDANTPPNGVARGVIQPNKPVDSGVVIKPPVHGHTMPVIKPPGTAR